MYRQIKYLYFYISFVSGRLLISTNTFITASAKLCMDYLSLMWILLTEYEHEIDSECSNQLDLYKIGLNYHNS